MNCQSNNKVGFNGSVQFFVYNENNQLVNSFQKKNTVYYTGKSAYKQILGTMDSASQPNANSLNDDYQVNLQSNSTDFLAKFGKTPFLQPITLQLKKDIQLQCAFRYANGPDDSDDPDDGYGIIYDKNGKPTKDPSSGNDFGFISNQEAFVKNSDNSVTTIKTNGSYVQVDKTKKVYFKNGEKWIYIYNVPQYQWFQYKTQEQLVQTSSSSNSDSTFETVQQITPILKKQFDGVYHSGLRVDIRGPQFQTFHMQIAYDFEGDIKIQTVGGYKNYNFEFEDFPPPIFPAMTGKPTNRQFAGFVGGALTNQAIHSYYFDLFPRYCKMPKKIIFLFEHSCRNIKNINNDAASFDISNIEINKIQFFKHTLPSCGPLAIYFENNNLQKYMTKITKVSIRDNSVCYYATLGYDQAVGMTFNKVGLSNSKNNYKFVPDANVNYAYNHNEEQKLTDTVPNTTGDYFYKLAKANANQCTNILTVADTNSWSFQKTSKNRIDIIYKMNINFGE